ncbi:MAG: glutathione S-transferase N-terminal domain-containing protein [Gaiellaceae bacterium]|jgi:hypothetical protein
MPPCVYRIAFSTNVERVALAPGHKGIELEWVDVDADDRSPVELVSGQPLVPVLVDGEFVLVEQQPLGNGKRLRKTAQMGGSRRRPPAQLA